MRIQGISLYYSSLNRIGLLKKGGDHRHVFCIAIVSLGLFLPLFLLQRAEELFVTLIVDCSEILQFLARIAFFSVKSSKTPV